MLPYVNMINHDANGTRRRANEAQAAALYQGLRRTARLVQAAAHALRRLWAAPVRALHSTPQKLAQSSRS